MHTLKYGDEIRPGDVIDHLGLGGPYLVERIDPPTAATLAIMPECVGYAVAQDGWTITLEASTQLTVAVPDPTCPECGTQLRTEGGATFCPVDRGHVNDMTEAELVRRWS